jgi:hypothetical protein
MDVVIWIRNMLSSPAQPIRPMRQRILFLHSQQSTGRAKTLPWGEAYNAMWSLWEGEACRLVSTVVRAVHRPCSISIEILLFSMGICTTCTTRTCPHLVDSRAASSIPQFAWVQGTSPNLNNEAVSLDMAPGNRCDNHVVVSMLLDRGGSSRPHLVFRLQSDRSPTSALVFGKVEPASGERSGWEVSSFQDCSRSGDQSASLARMETPDTNKTTILLTYHLKTAIQNLSVSSLARVQELAT